MSIAIDVITENGATFIKNLEDDAMCRSILEKNNFADNTIKQENEHLDKQLNTSFRETFLKSDKGNVTFNEVKDSGKREEFPTGSVRDTEDGKGRFDLIPTIALRRLAVQFQNGAKKYGDNNFKKGQRLGRYISSMMRHIMCIQDGLHDEDHEAAVAFNIFAFMWTADAIRRGVLGKELDDIGWVNHE